MTWLPDAPGRRVYAEPSPHWDERFLALAAHVAAWSKDRSRKVGAVIVGPAREIRGVGYNGFPRGVGDDVDARHQWPAKYDWTEHAERNAIYNAARVGIPVAECTMYLPWYPCADCARAIVQAGIAELVCGQEPDLSDPQWGAKFIVARDVLAEGLVQVRFVLSERGAAPAPTGPRLAVEDADLEYLWIALEDLLRRAGWTHIPPHPFPDANL